MAKQTIEKSSSWWEGKEPSGFTAVASGTLQAPIVMQVDGIRDRIWIQRQQLLSALQGLRKNKKTVGICHANVVSN